MWMLHREAISDRCDVVGCTYGRSIESKCLVVMVTASVTDWHGINAENTLIISALHRFDHRSLALPPLRQRENERCICSWEVLWVVVTGPGGQKGNVIPLLE